MNARLTAAFGGTALRQYAMLPVRLVIGYGFMVHGLAKWNRGPANFARLLLQLGVPAPAAVAWMVTLLEIFGGLAVLEGAFIAVVSIPLILSMLVAMFTIHVHFGFSSVNTIGLPLLVATDGAISHPQFDVWKASIAAVRPDAERQSVKEQTIDLNLQSRVFCESNVRSEAPAPQTVENGPPSGPQNGRITQTW